MGPGPSDEPLLVWTSISFPEISISEVPQMYIGKEKVFPACLLTAVMLLSPFLIVTMSAEETVSEKEPATRAEKYYLSEQDIYLPNAENKDNLYLIAWVESADTYIGTNINGGNYEFNFRTIANSFPIKIDGSTQSSGSKRRVMVELFTAKDCPYCPGADGSVDAVADERFPDDMTLISWHEGLEPGGDNLQNKYSEGRNSGYSVVSMPKPTVIFDGEIALVGGDPSASAPDLVKAYNTVVDYAMVEPPMVSISGSGSASGDMIGFNTSFQIMNPMPRGNWSFKVAVCEDIQTEHQGAEIRFIPKYVKTSRITGLLEGFPEVQLHDQQMFSDIDRNDVQEELEVLWTASDPEDGNDVEIDILISRDHEAWENVASGLSNTGSYIWDTLDPRAPDGGYRLRVLARDSDGNEVLSGEVSTFTLDNRDPPEGEITVPGKAGASLGGRITFKWNSSDDEDEVSQLKERVSISDDAGTTWRVLTTDPSGWETNDGKFMMNSLVYPDLDTYVLKVEIKDRDDMITPLISPRFEIYNNDAPEPTIISPAFKEQITGTLDIGWSAHDEEDVAWGMFENMTGNFSVRKLGKDEWVKLFIGHLDEEMENKTFDTSVLQGDGDYVLRFTVTDSRGRSAFVEREFSVYDPDPPVFTSPIKVPSTEDDHRNRMFNISWEAEDDDAGETIRYTLEISPVSENNWTSIAEKITDTEYSINLSGYQEGRYKLRITAVDSSPYKLSSEIEYGPFYWNAPDRPDLEFLSPYPGSDEVIEDETGLANLTGFMTYPVIWSGSDPDGDNITYSLYYKKQSDEEWTLVEDGMEKSSVMWNLSGFTDGKYLLRLVGVDSSPQKLSSEIIAGPYIVDVPWDPPVEDDDIEDDDAIDDNDTVDKGMDLTFILISATVIILLAILVAGLVIFLMSRIKGKQKETSPPVVPTESDVDLSSIPGFERQMPTNMPPQQMMQPQDPVQQTPARPMQEQSPVSGTTQAPEIPPSDKGAAPPVMEQTPEEVPTPTPQVPESGEQGLQDTEQQEEPPGQDTDKVSEEEEKGPMGPPPSIPDI